MDFDRPHRSGSSNSSSELFICFTSRNSSSSSSMKISSKSIISPGRTEKFREPTISFSSSLSRRLKSNGSMRGGQSSPMFPTGNKKRGAFENPEPSSPKVTCIGQVRVKKKKQGKKMGPRSRSSREVSFRKKEHSEEEILQQQHQQECLPHRNQRWVHLPLSICEALRGFGAEFNCFLPCGGRSTCSSMNVREKEEKRRTRPSETKTSSCGAVFARWLMALQDGEEEKIREKRADGFGEIEIEIEEKKGEAKGEIEEDEEERVSICIPPRNALLLMRCRSEPLRMSALANRFWDSSNTKIEDNEDEEEDSEYEENEEEERGEEEHEVEEMSVKWVSAEAVEDNEESHNEENPEDTLKEEKQEQVNPVKAEQHEEQGVELKEEEIMINGSSFEPVDQLENAEIKEKEEEEEEEEEEEPKLQERQVEKDYCVELKEEDIILNPGSSLESLDHHEKSEVEEKEEEEEEPKLQEILVEKEEERASFSTTTSSSTSYCEISVQFEEVTSTLTERVEKSTEEKETEERDSKEEEEAIETQAKSATTTEQEDPIYPEPEEKSKERETQEDEEEERKNTTALPNCLLMMMCEPKLSMEVSKETWVCRTDFIRSRPDKKVVPVDGRDELKNRESIDSNPPHQQRSRSSCSNPAQSMGSSMAAMIEQKLVNAIAYEPFVLTRCKSEPLRSSAKLVPEPCFWTNQSLEPHRLGVGATRVGL